MASEPGLGFLESRLHLDRENATYDGPGDNITGLATISFKPRHGRSEFSGPLVVSVVLKGALKDNRRHDRKPANTSMFDGDAKVRVLCRQAVCIHDAAVLLAKDDQISLPFSVSFPEFADARAASSSQEFDMPGPPTLSSQHDPTSMSLPPSYDEMVFDQIGLQPPMIVPKSCEKLPPAKSPNGYPRASDIEVGYQLTVIAESPGRTEGLLSRNASQRISYMPSTWQTVQGTDSFFHDFTVRSRSLLDHKSRDDTKGAINFMYGSWLYKEEYTPTFVGRLHVSGISSIIALHAGNALSELKFQISIYPQWDRCTVAELPDISLKNCKVHLITMLSSSSSSFGQNRARDEQSAKRISQEVEIKSVDPDGPFHAMPVEKGTSNLPVMTRLSSEEAKSSKGKAPAYLDRISDRDEEQVAGSCTSPSRRVDTQMDSNDTARAEKATLARRMAELDIQAGPSQSTATNSASMPPVVKLLSHENTHAFISPKQIETMPIYNVIPTLATDTSRRYEVRIQVDLLVGKQVTGATRSIPLLIHKSDPVMVASEGEVAGPPPAADEDEGMGGGDELPSYEDAVGLTRK
ncbi:hypothetical protein CERZMDRAFT_100006 [Cercospora zeae-maydis SCOH1-5]|uniref:Uncharacterized protein n=1 Tax=Cercospora zeae-maydis SCOH1-5 TaxID=717836 RepID=A0A6A6F975_9PEZI|nr:hypothetical protein CERZMDRAFT_100006 [Cercospora zeae-maydis SCOH1-5]